MASLSVRLICALLLALAPWIIAFLLALRSGSRPSATSREPRPRRRGASSGLGLQPEVAPAPPFSSPAPPVFRVCRRPASAAYWSYPPSVSLTPFLLASAPRPLAFLLAPVGPPPALSLEARRSRVEELVNASGLGTRNELKRSPTWFFKGRLTKILGVPLPSSTRGHYGD